MTYPNYFLLLVLVAFACNTTPAKQDAGSIKPEAFLADIVADNQMVHAGVFTPDMQDYYFTLSDVEFGSFTVMHSRQLVSGWSRPDTAFFNSEYFEHGVHFTRDNRWLYFCSTRPLDTDTLADTWHIWRCRKSDETWSDPEYVHIPGLGHKLVSHPSMTNEGRLYFHSGNTDYSDLALYFADQHLGQFKQPKKVTFPNDMNQNTITPFVAPDESYLLFAKIADGKEELFISYKEDGLWNQPIRLNDVINTNNRGNPFVTPDNQYLYYATGELSAYGLPFNWRIQKVSIEAITGH